MYAKVSLRIQKCDTKWKVKFQLKCGCYKCWFYVNEPQSYLKIQYSWNNPSGPIRWKKSQVFKRLENN